MGVEAAVGVLVLAVIAVGVVVVLLVVLVAVVLALVVVVVLALALVVVVVLVLAGVAVLRSDDWRRPGVIGHWLAVCGATALFAAAAGIYRYYNMQYEIRELFVVLGVAHWLTGWAPRRPVPG